MRVECVAVAACLVLGAVSSAAAESSTGKVAPGPTVITCASLANLRAVLRSAKDDANAAIPIVSDPKSDLGCSVLDRSAVTGIADHVSLNGASYDCVSLKSTRICHWIVAGSIVVPEAPEGERPRSKPSR